MAKRLWRVQVEWEYYAWAEDEDEARDEYRDAESDMDSISATTWADPATLKTLPNDWAKSIPYGSDDNRTCAQILEDEAAQEAEKAAWDAHPKLPLEIAA